MNWRQIGAINSLIFFLLQRYNIQEGMLCQDVKIRIHMECCDITNSDSSDETIDELSHGTTLLAASSIKCCNGIIVYRLNWKRRRSGKQSKMLLVVSTGKHFHAHNIARDDFGIQKIVNSLADGGTGIAQKFYPGGGVDKNQGCEIANPASTAQISRLFESKWISSQSSQREIYCVTFFWSGDSGASR